MKTNCQHSTLIVEYLSNEKGAVQLEICMDKDCSKIVHAICEHKENEWRYTRNPEDSDEQILICKLCGADGT